MDRRQNSYLLLLATPVAVNVMELEFDPDDTTGGLDNYYDPAYKVSLQRGKVEQVPTDNVTMGSIVGSPDGRIFMAGSDGAVYVSRASHIWAFATWGQNRCAGWMRTWGRIHYRLYPLITTLLVCARVWYVCIVKSHPPAKHSNRMADTNSCTGTRRKGGSRRPAPSTAKST
jgi:hypothetical protein